MSARPRVALRTPRRSVPPASTTRRRSWVASRRCWPGTPPAGVFAALAATPDPRLAVAGLGASAGRRTRGGRRRSRHDAERAAALVTLLGASNLIVRWLVGRADALAGGAGWRRRARTPIATLEPRAGGARRREPGGAGAPAAGLQAPARPARSRRAICSAAARSTETMPTLSRLAEDALEVAVAAVRARLVAAHGDVARPTATPLGFCVLGMGKLGGGELNFSSDIDLVYVYGDGGGESAGGPRGTLSAREFMSRLAEGVTRALHQATDDGFVFRVDLRLRPEGTNGPIVNPVANALLYYESWGQTWERAVYLKARPVAGDRALGEALLRDLEPFIYRRYLDYATLEDLKQMKAKVERALAAGPEQGHQRQARPRRHPRGRVRDPEPAADPRRQGRAHPRAQLARGARALRRGALSRAGGERAARATPIAFCATSSTRSSSSTSARRR